MKPRKAYSALLTPSGDYHVIKPNLVSVMPESLAENQEQTAAIFSDKWNEYELGGEAFESMVANQKKWYLSLYGFASESALKKHLEHCRVVLDAGAGTGYKAAWFAELSPSTIVVAADISRSLFESAKYYEHLENLLFVQCDIGSMPFFAAGLFDYVSCDQVIHHTTDPYITFKELVRITGLQKELSVYVYRKKALPRELLDDYFREYSKTLGHEELMTFSRQITDLGKLLSANEEEIHFPDIPVLGIVGGKMSIQRFIYWNFLKCYWNETQGYHNSVMTNYDWYSPSQAFRYSEEEFRGWIESEKLVTRHFHQEEACYSGRFQKQGSGQIA